jgi:predicted ArsR family transcriptional regulator
MKNISTQDLILDAFRDTRSFSAHDLGVICAISQPAVRYHLRNLLHLGLIQVIENNESSLKAGRKATMYRRINPNKNQNINRLCSVLLNLVVNTSDQDKPTFLKSIAEQILENQKDTSDNRSISIRNLVEWLNQHQYSAGWEAGKQGPILHFSNCPYREIRSGNEILCELDVKLIQILNGQPWELVQTMNWERMSGVCQFVVKPQANR